MEDVGEDETGAVRDEEASRDSLAMKLLKLLNALALLYRVYGITNVKL